MKATFTPLMHCMPKKNIDAITASKNDFLIALKGNRHEHYHDVKALLGEMQPVSVGAVAEKNKGRSEIRYIEVYDNPSGSLRNWDNINSITKTIRQRDGKETVHYHVSSLDPLKENACDFMEYIRLHWSIENTLHYVKDTVLNEDSTKTYEDNGAKVMSIIRNICINCFRRAGEISITNAITMFSHDILSLWDMIK